MQVIAAELHVPLIRTSLLKLATDEYLLILIMHHNISDGWSMGVFFEELDPLYRSLVERHSLPPS